MEYGEKGKEKQERKEKLALVSETEEKNICFNYSIGNKSLEKKALYGVGRYFKDPLLMAKPAGGAQLLPSLRRTRRRAILELF